MHRINSKTGHRTEPLAKSAYAIFIEAYSSEY